ncbi:hypothetical protein HBH49_072490 [Parastagonospora nodorum]|nr:hypothetical protein HBH49_072490 [Parastagonospora nodorum]
MIGRRYVVYLLIFRGLENSASASLLVYSDYALQECSLLNVRYVQRPADDSRNPASPRFLNTLVGIVLYNAIKEYYDDGTRKIIYFHGYTVEDNYNAICEKSNVTVLDDYYDNDVNNILMKWKREDNILTVDEYRTGYSNEEDIEADERESIVTDSTWDEFAMLAEEYTIDNCIELELEDCDALVERYEEEINCSDLYSTV